MRRRKFSCHHPVSWILMDAHGRSRYELGPGTVTIVGKAQFHVEVAVGHSVNIKATSAGYSSGR